MRKHPTARPVKARPVIPGDQPLTYEEACGQQLPFQESSLSLEEKNLPRHVARLKLWYIKGNSGLENTYCL